MQGNIDFVFLYDVRTGCAAHLASHPKDAGGSFSQGVKQPVDEANHPHPSTMKMKNVWNYTFTPYPIEDLCAVSKGRVSL
jgi:hypothetical protein